MGDGGWSSATWQTYSTQNVQGKSQAQVFSSSRLDEGVDPRKFKGGLRESVDGPDNPRSTPVALFVDGTGSMGHLADVIMRKLDTVCQELIDRAPVTDVHLMTGLVGDGYTDNAPLQATQFEADIRIAEQTQKLWTGGCHGGGNGGESYGLAWATMAYQTATDCYDKRGKKGYLFTVGDEGIHGVSGGNGREFAVTVEQAERLLGLSIEKDMTAEELYAVVSQRWNVYHIVVGGGSSSYKDDVMKSFGKIMPERLLWLEGGNVDLLPELVVSTIQFNEGTDKATVAKSWSGDTSVVIVKAMRDLVERTAAGEEVVAL